MHPQMTSSSEFLVSPDSRVFLHEIMAESLGHRLPSTGLRWLPAQGPSLHGGPIYSYDDWRGGVAPGKTAPQAAFLPVWQSNHSPSWVNRWPVSFQAEIGLGRTIMQWKLHYDFPVFLKALERWGIFERCSAEGNPLDLKGCYQAVQDLRESLWNHFDLGAFFKNRLASSEGDQEWFGKEFGKEMSRRLDHDTPGRPPSPLPKESHTCSVDGSLEVALPSATH